MSTHKLAACLFVLVSMAPLSAGAEEPAPSDSKPVENGNYAYTFEDDPLAAGGFDASSSLVRVRGGAARVMLMRPRLHFVPELLKSAEGL